MKEERGGGKGWASVAWREEKNRDEMNEADRDERKMGQSVQVFNT